MITKYLIVFLISMVPLIELRGAIPYAVAFHIPTLPAYLIAVIGNMLPVPVIFLFARKVLVWGCDKKYIGKFFTWWLEKGEKGGEKLTAKAGRGLPLALLLFVGIPLYVTYGRPAAPRRVRPSRREAAARAVAAGSAVPTR